MIRWDVEIGSFTFEILMASLSKEVKWAPNQAATVWFFHKTTGEHVRLEGDIQMLDLIEMYKSEMGCEVVVSVFDKVVCAEHEYDALEPLCVLPPDDDIPETDVGFSQHIEQLDIHFNHKTGNGASASEVPNSKVPKAMEADAPEPDREPDIFDNEEEYVGVDDEHFYMPLPPAQPLPQPADNAQPAENAQPTDDVDVDGYPDAFAAEGGIPLDAEVNDADPQEIQVLHDPENPRIEKRVSIP